MPVDPQASERGVSARSRREPLSLGVVKIRVASLSTRVTAAPGDARRSDCRADGNDCLSAAAVGRIYAHERPGHPLARGRDARDGTENRRASPVAAASCRTGSPAGRQVGGC